MQSFGQSNNISTGKATIAAQVDFRPIYELCMGAEMMPGASMFMRWWDQEVGQEVELPRD